MFVPRPPLQLLALALAWTLATPAPAATFTVNTAFDSDDGSCDPSPDDCTLREAILAANGNGEADDIEFDIPGGGVGGVHTILVQSVELPAITDELTIDGTTQPTFAGTPVIDLRGIFAGLNADGFVVDAADVTLRGLIVGFFSGRGIHLRQGGNGIVEGCFVGMSATVTATGNGIEGILVESDGNRIGGAAAGQANVISANDSVGVFVAGADDNQILGNFIGTDPAVSNDLGNDYRGIQLTNAARTQVRDNTIQYNGGEGIAVEFVDSPDGEFTGNTIRLNDDHGIFILGAAGNVIGGDEERERNVIDGNRDHGVLLDCSVGNDATGTTIMGNTITQNDFGVWIDGCSGVRVGGPSPAEGNWIAGNRGGVRISGADATGNVVQANRIGTTQDGTAAQGNSDFGVLLTGGASENTVGGTNAGEGNLISGHDSGPIGIDVGVGITGAHDNLVLGNFIGTDVTGTAAIPNDVGVRIVNGDGNQIGSETGTTPGGPCTGGCNLISGHGNLGGMGVHVRSTGEPGSVSNTVAGSYIGTDVTGTQAIPNTTGVMVDELGSEFAESSRANNVRESLVSGNTGGGIVMNGFLNGVTRSFVGTDVGGTTPLPNGSHGVVFGGDGNTVGGGVAAWNGGAGLVLGELVRNSWASETSFHSNGGLGIDLGGDGVTPNVPGDGGRPNFPRLLLATASDGTTTVVGTLDGLANLTYEIAFYANDVCDPSGYGEGQTFLGDTRLETDANGNAAFIYQIDAAPVGTILTANAREAQGNMESQSEFSLCREVVADTDGDQVADFADNCTEVANPDQFDVDGDGYGTACDADFDQDLPLVGTPDLLQFRLAIGKPRESFQCPHDDGSIGASCEEFDLNEDELPVIGTPDLLRFRQLLGKAPGPSAFAPVCGNGVVEPTIGEQCDDRNVVGGDGCSPTCQIEP